MHQEQKEYQTLILTEVPDISEDNGEAQRLLDLTRSEILSSFQNVVPLSQTSPEKINQIRNWGKERGYPLPDGLSEKNSCRPGPGSWTPGSWKRYWKPSGRIFRKSGAWDSSWGSWQFAGSMILMMCTCWTSRDR